MMVGSKKELLKQKRAENQVRYYLITANQLGWINVDRFYNNPEAEEVKLLANLNAPDNLEFINVSLVFKTQNTFLSGYITDDGRYRFTKDNEGYNKLPVGETATIVAISHKDEQPILGMKEIVIGEEELINIDLQLLALEEFQAQLSRLNQ